MKIRIKLKDDDKATIQELPKEEFNNTNKFKLIMSTKSKLDNALSILMPFDSKTNKVTINKKTITNFFKGLNEVDVDDVFEGRDYGEKITKELSNDAIQNMIETGEYVPFKLKLNIDVQKENAQKKKYKPKSPDQIVPLETRSSKSKSNDISIEDFVNAGYSEKLAKRLVNNSDVADLRRKVKIMTDKISQEGYNIPLDINAAFKSVFKISQDAIVRKILTLDNDDKKRELVDKIHDAYNIAYILSTPRSAANKKLTTKDFYDLIIKLYEIIKSVIKTVNDSTKITDSLTFNKQSIDYDAFQDLRAAGLPKAMFKYNPEDSENSFAISKGFFKKKLDQSGLKDKSVKIYNSVVRAINMLTLDLILDEGLEDNVLTIINCLNNLNSQTIKPLLLASLDITNPGEYSEMKRAELDEEMRQDQEKRNAQMDRERAQFIKSEELEKQKKLAIDRKNKFYERLSDADKKLYDDLKVELEKLDNSISKYNSKNIDMLSPEAYEYNSKLQERRNIIAKMNKIKSRY